VTRPRQRSTTAFALGALVCAVPAFATDPLPTLNELLGLVEDETDARDADAAELERKLTAQDATEQLAQAVDLMGDAADRLSGDTPDAGLATQRLQEDILSKLDMAIAASDENQDGGGGSSGSSSQQGEQQASPEQSQAAGTQAGSGESQSESSPPGLEGTELDPSFVAQSAEWGALPARTRDALLEGLTDSFSSLYRKLTEAYYQRLAEPEQDAP
jgi:hypothetical protein